MFRIIQILGFFWLIRTFKIVLFWIYLWQIKEYHMGRLLDHFETHKGKRLIFGPMPTIKIFILILFFTGFFPIAFYTLLLVYIIEFLNFIISILRKNLKKPVLTPKAIFLTLVSIATVILYLFIIYNYVEESFWFAFYLIFFDILAPIFISFIVLFFQPFFVFIRNRIIKKAKEKIEKFKNLTVIGITGSYGKTSTKEFLHVILSKKFNVLATKDHQNSEIGISQCILDNLKEDHQVFIVEMGSYNKGGISLLCDIVKPKIGIVTGVNEQHLALFGSLENLLSAEGGWELVKCLPQDGLIVLNGDNKYCLDLYKKIKIKKKIYTINRDKIYSDIWTEDVVIEKSFISFIVESGEKEMAHFSLNVLGKQNVQNILGAILVAKEFGMNFEEISDACKNIKQDQAGITLQNGIHGINIIDSSYSSNPDGVIADLDYLNIFSQKKVVVMPCLIELGPKSTEIHYKIGKKISEICDFAIITTKDRFEDLKKGAIENGFFEDKIVFSDNPKDIFAMITTFCKEGDAVLLEGRIPNELIKLLSK